LLYNNCCKWVFRQAPSVHKIFFDKDPNRPNIYETLALHEFRSVGYAKEYEAMLNLKYGEKYSDKEALK